MATEKICKKFLKDIDPFSKPFSERTADVYESRKPKKYKVIMMSGMNVIHRHDGSQQWVRVRYETEFGLE